MDSMALLLLPCEIIYSEVKLMKHMVQSKLIVGVLSGDCLDKSVMSGKAWLGHWKGWSELVSPVNSVPSKWSIGLNYSDLGIIVATFSTFLSELVNIGYGCDDRKFRESNVIGFRLIELVGTVSSLKNILWSQ